MITIGVDPHKRVNEAVALDDSGNELNRWRGPNDGRGWQACYAWARSLGADRQFGVEGAGSLGRGLAQYLVNEGEVVFEINPRWTAMVRVRARRSDKTDRLDARAVAPFVHQEGPDLPRVGPEDDAVALDILTCERESARRRVNPSPESAACPLAATRPTLSGHRAVHEDRAVHCTTQGLRGPR